MVSEAKLNEYLAEIREHVCSCCAERPPGGPPCVPLGRPCGIELHLSSIIDAIHGLNADWMKPYLEHNRHAMLLVQAVKTVDERHADDCQMV
ncbi:MAG: hypothetical protein JNM56_03505 [Planctomycetia bacterium]|nr:hypothetical protein [Planctomycetia bacterium]